MPKQLTHEEYARRLLVQNPTVEVLEQYRNYRTPIQHWCTVHRQSFVKEPRYVLDGVGCNLCEQERQPLKAKMNNDKYKQKLFKKHPHIVNVDDYVGFDIDILHKCTICGSEFYATPYLLLRTINGCIQCWYKSQTKTPEQYIRDVEQVHQYIEVIDDYIDAKTKIRHRCTLDGTIWSATPNNVLRGKGCPTCGLKSRAQKRAKTTSQFTDELAIVNPNVLLIGEYQGSRTHSRFKCKLCGHEWEAQSSSVLCGCGCPMCDISKGEREIDKFLHNNNIEHKHQKRFDDCRDLNPLPFDFYLPDCNVCIEFDGRQHYEPVERFGGEEALKLTQYHDSIKNNYCMSNGLMLLRIGFWNDDSESIQQILNMLINTIQNDYKEKDNNGKTI